MSLIYEVNVEVDVATAPSYLEWLRPHMQQIVALPGFESATLYERDPKDDGADSHRARWTVHYLVRSRADLDRYLREDAPRLRAEGRERFGEAFLTTRRVLVLTKP